MKLNPIQESLTLFQYKQLHHCNINQMTITNVNNRNKPTLTNKNTIKPLTTVM